MEMNEKIKILRERYGLTLEEIGDAVGVGKSTVKKWEDGAIANMKRDKIAALAKALHTSPAYLMGWPESENASRMVPVLGRVQAGIPVEAIQEIIDYEEIDKDMAQRGEYFGLQVNGDSMEPKFSQGDVVIVLKQPDVDSGQIGIIVVNGSDATIKRVVKHEEGGISLIALNPVYPPKYYTDKEIRNMPVTIIGRAVELRAKF